MPDFTTGPSLLPDVGKASYNGCVFSALFESNVSGTVVKDNAGRTTKFMDYVITLDGYVTLPTGATNIEATAQTMSVLLSAQGGELLYNGRGIKLNVGGRGSPVQDVAWGPTTELHEFQPLGGGLSAKCKITIRTRIVQGQVVKIGGRLQQGFVLQFNQEIGVTYNEDGFSSLSIRGTLEVPMTRPSQEVRTLTSTVDDLREKYMNEIVKSIDLDRFRITKRNFPVSRDRRTMEWDFEAEELPYMQMPAGCTIARGNYTVRPAKQGMGLCTWFCTLSATYTVRKDSSRRTAWLAFLALLRERMHNSSKGNVPANLLAQEQQNNAPPVQNQLANLAGAGFALLSNNPSAVGAAVAEQMLNRQAAQVRAGRRAFLIDFNFNEGVYLDSKAVTFGASWRLVTTFSHILMASGIWRKLDERNQSGDNYWAVSMRDISGPFSWTANRVDASQDVIVDFGNPGV